MELKGLRYVLFNEAGDDAGGGGGGGGADAAAAAEAAAAGGAASSGAVQGDGDTGKGGAAAGDNALAQAQAAQALAIPEKYQVKKEDGTVDYEATALKVSEAHGHLEKRMGSGDIPPKAHTDYTVTVPDQFKEMLNPAEDPAMQAFLKGAHEKGYTQSQIDFAMDNYFQIAPALVNGGQQLSVETCTADLRTEWKTDAEFKAGVQLACNAAVTYAGEDADYIIKTYGNDPKLIRMLNRMGAEMGEDDPPNIDGGGHGSGDDISALLASEAYTNPKHADHATVSRKVQQHFARQAAAAEKAGNTPVM